MTTFANLETILQLASQLRVDSIRCSTSAGSGHPTSSLSAADLMAVLLTNHMRYDWTDPKLPTNDHLIFSKGHASPLLYAMFRAVGAISEHELLTTYRRFGSRLQGHPTPTLPWVDVATGSLGLGLSCAVGMALAGKHLEKLPYHVWVLCGDSEMAEGSMWEALDKASYFGLSNLTAIVDINGLGQRGPTELGWNLDAYQRRVESFGCRAILADGHDVYSIDAALATCREDAEHVCVVLARTVKGSGVKVLEHAEGWHGRALPADLAEQAVIELGGPTRITITSPPPYPPPTQREIAHPSYIRVPQYELGALVATRRAFGETLVQLSQRPDVIALDGEVANSTYTELFAAKCHERFFELFISEQQMIATAIGLAARGFKPFASTFAAFVSRAADFIRMAAISQVNICINGSHAGVEIGADGPSQMGLEDLALMQSVQGSIVLYPSDATSAAALTAAMVDLEGISYLRTTRGAYPVLYDANEEFTVGGSKVLRSSNGDDVCLIGAGITVHQCLEAAKELAKEGVSARVIDLYSVKPIDTATLVEACLAVNGQLVIAEDHHPEGGLGAAVALALSTSRKLSPTIAHMAVRSMPMSGTSAELLEFSKISADYIKTAARTLVKGR